jgi:NAD(P)-dependent dehydrogenase (short-subunit alcohol dehydrogenase family)
LITGAGSGIGRAAAQLFAAEGGRVFLLGRRAVALEEVAAAIHMAGGVAVAHPADVRDDNAVRAAVGAAVAQLGGLDVLVNSAGHAPEWTPVHETPDETWDEVFDINLKGAFRMTRAALPHLVQRRGAIVNVSSISALKALHSVASYSAAKAGLIALTRCIAAEYGWQGVRCNCVVPSWVETPMTEAFLAEEQARTRVGARHMLQRVAEPEEVARAILFLAGPDASFVTGSAHLVDGGMATL